MPLEEIISGGPPKNGIPSIDDPRFVPVAAETGLAPQEPVIGLIIAGDARAYPLRILHWHEIVNDVVGGRPVAVTYCPLCNLPLVWDRRMEERVLEFDTTGKLRLSDLVMYDRETESWWQQATGTAIDQAAQPFLYRGEIPEGVEPMMRVVAVGNEAWSLDLLRQRRQVESQGLVLSWQPGQASALDTQQVAAGRDVGNILVQRRTESSLEDAAHMITFAFAFFAFHPDGVLHTPDGTVRREDRSG